jgi:signal peptidase I
MGDNRGNSRDSRYHLENGVNGAVPLKNVLGRVFVIIWPTESFGRVGVPDIYSEIPDPKE